MMTTVGINTLVYMDALQAGAAQSALLNEIASYGVTLAEVRYEYIADEQEQAAIHDCAQQHGLELYLSVPESLVITEQGEHKIHPQFEQFLEEAQRMGVRQVKFNQGSINTAPASLIAAIDAKAQAMGVRLTIENDQTVENGTFACTQATLQHLRELNSEIGYTFDAGNWYWQGGDPHTAFEALQADITVFHLKNIAGSKASDNLHTVLLDEGMIDWKHMLHALPEQVPVFLEYPISRDDIASQLAAVREVVKR